MKPLAIEIIAYAPTAFFHCTHCELVWKETGYGAKIHGEQLRSGLPEDMQHEYVELTAWINKLVDRYWDRISIRVIDAASPEGFLKSIRHRLRNFPTIVVNGDSRYVRDLDAAEADIVQRLAASAATEEPG
jgi:hypothetical protein